MTKRVRMIAGPNGSGKTSVVKPILEALNYNLGIYVNADEIEVKCRENLFLDFSNYQIVATKADFDKFAKSHGLTRKYRIPVSVARYFIHYWNSFVFIFNINFTLPSFDFDRLSWNGNKVNFPKWFVHSYFSALLADYVRHKLIESGHSFTFETVMSDNNKIEFLAKAKKLGYRVYVYFVTTQSPEINLARVQERVKKGGHNVPPRKIRKRYTGSSNLLYDAILNSDRCFLWDNSYKEGNSLFIAEVEAGNSVKINPSMKLEDLPEWFNIHIVDKARQRKQEASLNK